MEIRRNTKDSASLGNVLKCACLVVLFVALTSCEGKKSAPPPAQISKDYCAENKILVEKLSANAINKEVVIVGGGTGLAGCGALVLLTAGMDLGALAGICTLIVATTTWTKVLTMDEAATVKKVLDKNLDPRCATLQK